MIDPIFDYIPFYETLKGTKLEPWLETLPALVNHKLSPTSHGDLLKWTKALYELPDVSPSDIDLVEKVMVGRASDLTAEQRESLIPTLKQFHPWRKGPMDLFDTHIETEWRSDWKWDRLKDAVGTLEDRIILDVGCGNGYFSWRMAGMGARQVIGVDPFMAFVMQYHVFKKYMPEMPVTVLPIGIEHIPPKLNAFDLVFSMGVLYHRRSPIHHLEQLRDCLKPKGKVVLETIVVDGDLGYTLVPEGRYAQMRNVWFLPSIPTLMSWMKKVRFKNIQLVDVTPTTSAEQRTTDWMVFKSYGDFLDPNDPNLTIEGHPAPKRAMIVADV